MKQMIYCYEPLNDDSMTCMIHFEPFVFDDVDDAVKNASILKMLRHNEFYCVDYDEVRSNFDYLFVDAIPDSSSK